MRLHQPVPHERQGHLGLPSREGFAAGGYSQGSGGLTNPSANASPGQQQLGAYDSSRTSAGTAGNNEFGSWGGSGDGTGGSSDPTYTPPAAGSGDGGGGSGSSSASGGAASSGVFGTGTSAGSTTAPAPKVPAAVNSTPATTGGGYGSAYHGSEVPGVEVDPSLYNADFSPKQPGSSLSGAYGLGFGPGIQAGSGYWYRQGGPVGYDDGGEVTSDYTMNLGDVANAASALYQRETQTAGNIPAKPAGPGGDTPGTTQPAPGSIPLSPGQKAFGTRVSDAEEGGADMGKLAAKRGGIIPRQGLWRGGNPAYLANLKAWEDAGISSGKNSAAEDMAKEQGDTQRDVAGSEAQAKLATAGLQAETAGKAMGAKRGGLVKKGKRRGMGTGLKKKNKEKW
jgi:hypothetical protein